MYLIVAIQMAYKNQRLVSDDDHSRLTLKVKRVKLHLRPGSKLEFSAAVIVIAFATSFSPWSVVTLKLE